MPWKEKSVVNQRLEFVTRALRGHAPLAERLPGVRDLAQDRLQVEGAFPPQAGFLRWRMTRVGPSVVPMPCPSRWSVKSCG